MFRCNQLSKHFALSLWQNLSSDKAIIKFGGLCLLTLGIVGKTNTGKTTLFNAATLLNAKISNCPFTTKEPNIGIAYVCDICVCKELGVKDNPLNSTCIDGWRYIPIKIMDVPGLIKDAWKGRGLGNQFLSVIGSSGRTNPCSGRFRLNRRRRQHY
jgi:GTPase involved in cell partitioning and DNA repair